MLVLGFQHLAARLEVGVQTGHLLPEVVQRAFEEFVGHKEVLLHIALLQAVARLARQNHQFADDVLAAEVDARVGLGVTLLLRHPDGPAEGRVGAYLVEDVVQRAAQHRFNLQNLVAAVDEVVDGVDDGKPRAHVRLEQVFHAALAGNLLQFAVVLVLGGGGNLVGGNHRDVVQQQVLVEGSDVGACRAVHKHGVEDVHADNLVAQVLQRAAAALLMQHLAEVGQVDAASVEQRFLAVGNAHHVELQAVFAHQFLPLAVDLLYQAAAHRAYAADEEVQHLVFGQEEGVVDDVQRLAQRLAVHHKRDVRLRGSLRAGYHVDAVASQRAEQLSGDARRVLHVLAHDGDRGEVLLCLNGRNLSHLYLLGELLVQHLARQVGVRVAHTDGRRVLRRGLRHQEHADAVLRQSLEDAVVHADDTDHAQALHRNQARVVDGGDALDCLALRVGHLLLDDGARPFGVEGVLHPDGDVLVADRINRRRIDHLGAEVAKLRCLHVAQFIDGIGGGNHARVGGHESVHVRPYLQAVGVQRGGNDCRGVVGTAPAQVRHLARHLVCRDEARHQRAAGHRAEGLAHQPVRQFGVQHVLGVLLLRLDERARIKPFGSRQPGGDDGREALAVAHNRVGGLL